MDALLIALIGLFGGGCLGFAVAWFSGAIVPGTRVTELQTELGKALTNVDKFAEANRILQKTVDGYEAEMKRSAENQQLANTLLSGIKEYLRKPGE